MMPNKMSGSNSFDTTGKIIMDNCLCRKRVVSEEIKTIMPNIIVFYTNTNYDEYITDDDCIFDSFEVNNTALVDVGKRKMPWMEGIGHIKGMEDIRVLRRACKKKGCWLQQPF